MADLLARPNPHLHLVPAESGEMIASWLFRISKRHGMSFSRFCTLYLPHFGRTPSVDAFPNLERIYALGAAARSEQPKLIQHHTLLETMRPYCTQPRWVELVARIKQTPRQVLPYLERGWRICPVCRQNESRRGLSTWKRNHQIMGVRYCSEHAVPLQTIKKKRGLNITAPAQDEADDAISLRVSDSRREELHIKIARDLANSLDAGLPCLGSAKLREMVLNLARRNKNTKWSARGGVSATFIRESIDSHFGAAFVNELELDSSLSKCQAKAIYGRGIVMLAVIARTFGTTLKTAFHDAVHSKKDEGPWNCANDHFFCGGKPTIRRFKVVAGRAWFSCPVCHVSYSKRYPISALDKIEFPFVEEAVVERILERWPSVRGDARRVRAAEHVSIPTIYQVATQHDLPHIDDSHSRKMLAAIDEDLMRLRNLLRKEPLIKPAKLSRFIPWRRQQLIRAVYHEEFTKMCGSLRVGHQHHGEAGVQSRLIGVVPEPA